MAGGIWRPFTLNVKCIIFSLLVMAALLVPLPLNRPLVVVPVLFVTFVVAYVAMAWYDYVFDCQYAPLLRGRYGVTTKMKPEVHSPLQTRKPPMPRAMSYIIWMSHIIFIVPLLAYIVIRRHRVHPGVYYVTGTLAVFTFMYHAAHMTVGVLKAVAGPSPR